MVCGEDTEEENSLAKIAKNARKQRFKFGVSNAQIEFLVPTLAVLAVLARDIPAPLPFRCDLLG